MKIGRHEIKFGRCWIQTYVPTAVRCCLGFWIFKKASPTDIDKKKQFPLGTPLEHEGTLYHYYKMESPLHKSESQK